MYVCMYVCTDGSGSERQLTDRGGLEAVLTDCKGPGRRLVAVLAPLSGRRRREGERYGRYSLRLP